MWLMTQHGFYSIVQKGDGSYHIRARVRKDLENVLEMMGWEYKIEVWPNADYRYRIIVKHVQVVALTKAIAEQIDYDNFKSRIHELRDQKEKSAAYGKVWGVMAGLQSRGQSDKVSE